MKSKLSLATSLALCLALAASQANAVTKIKKVNCATGQSINQAHG